MDSIVIDFFAKICKFQAVSTLTLNLDACNLHLNAEIKNLPILPLHVNKAPYFFGIGKIFCFKTQEFVH